MKNIEFKGVKYTPVKSDENDSCAGCDLHFSESGCRIEDTPTEQIAECDENQIIYKEE